MGWGNAIGAVVGLYGASQQKKAAGKQAKAAQAGLDWTKQVYQDAQGNFSPYLDFGQTGLGGLNALFGGDYSGFYDSPDYMAARDAMNYGLDHSAAARGRLYSGGYMADLSKAQGDLASQYLNNYRNALFHSAQMGQNAASQLGSIGNANAAQVANGYNTLGQAQAMGNVANANMFGSVAGGLSGLLYGGSTYGQQPAQGSSGGVFTNYGYGPQ